MAEDHPSAGDLVGGQHEQGAQQLGGLGGVQAELGENAPALQVGEAVLDGCAFDADQPVDLLLCGGEGLVAGGFPASDDRGLVGVVVQADEAEVGWSHAAKPRRGHPREARDSVRGPWPGIVQANRSGDRGEGAGRGAA
ncbi:hypothetical protein Misp02_09210 [Microtetraspora sp. NBRC 16547]|nr:hypothetical protein Misp02_09210 [Microtetraspora sp. NBRC 16547]